MSRSVRTPRRHRFARPAILLAVGLAISVLIAEACALWSPIVHRSHHSRYCDRGESRWRFAPSAVPPAPLPPFAPLEQTVDPAWLEPLQPRNGLFRAEDLFIAEGVGVRFALLQIDCTSFESGSQHAIIRQLRSGWPAPCLAASMWSASPNWSAAPPIQDTSLAAPRPLLPGENYDTLTPRILPYSPLYPGLILNTVFYSASLWTLTLGRAALLRTLRRRANRCPNCGYNLKGLPADAAPACPECGNTRIISAAKL